MAEPLKNLFNAEVIGHVGDHLAKAWDGFDRVGFVKAAATNLDALELKQRSNQIEAALERYLPDDFPTATDIILQSLHPDEDAGTTPVAGEAGIAGWAIMPISGYVGRHGVGHLDLALDVMRELTKRLTAEFGIRFLILADPDRCLAKLRGWTDDPNRHVRRLVSEGTRPRLPWTPQLPMFIADPAPLLPLLTALRDDSEEYVRRSVANNLNDIAKDHPDLVADLAADWLADAPEPRQRLVRHACRTLIKAAHPGALAALGYRAAKLTDVELRIDTPVVDFGTALEFSLEFRAGGKAQQDMLIDYVVHHQKANGQLTPKVFKWKTMRTKPGETVAMRRRHAMRPITTRVYYPGTHRLEVQVNGVTVAGADFRLEMPEGT